jgi:signal transduction histidine kinase
MARPLWYAVAVAVAYAVASLPGQALLIPNVFVAPIRISAGVAIAALTFAPTRHWWLVVLALIPLHAAVGDPSTMYRVARQYFAANTAEALTVALLLRWFIGQRPRLDDLRSCVIFVGAGVILGPIVGATIGAPAVISRDLTVSGFSTWQVWTFADAVGNLIVVPLCLAVADLYLRHRSQIWQRPSAIRVAEMTTVWLGILLTTAPALGQAALGRPGPSLSMLYAPFPLLVWASIRFGPLGAAAANLLLTVVTMLHALTARAPFGQLWDANTVLETQQFLIIACATSITLAALVAERWRAIDARREEEERRRLALSSVRIGTWVWVFESNRFLVSDELAALIGLDASVVGELAENVTALDRIIHPDDLQHVHNDLAMFRHGTTGERSRQFRSVRADGTTEWIKVKRPADDDDGEVTGELRILRPDGAIVWIESHGRVLRDGKGVPDRAIGVVIDISERKELQAEREAATQALMRLARSTFADRGELEEALREITATAAATLGVERAGVWLLSDDRKHLRCVCLYERTAHRYSSGDELTVETSPEYFKAIHDMRTLAVEDTSTDPLTRELAAVHLPLGIRSLLDAPLYIGGRLAGVFGFQHVGPPREWSLPARNFAASMTDLLSRAFEAVERRKAEERLQRAYEQLRNLARRLEAAKEDERRDIARELHDELGQSVTAIVIGLHLVAIDDREGRHAARLKETVALAERLIGRVRTISLNLRPPLLDELGLVTALRGFIDGQAQQSGLAINFTADGVDQRLASELQIGAFRIVQECLTNVARHAAARSVEVNVAAEDGQLLIAVKDDGRGFDVAEALAAAARGKHLGLLGLQERVMVLGGQVDFVSAPGQGTAISARLPLQLAQS